MCFRPAAVTLDPEAKGTTPEYRVAAFASVDLREHMEKNPHKIITADNITWEVTRDSEGLYVAKGDLSRVTGWLREHIHRYASFKKPGELFREICGEFDAKYYTDYLTKKYSELYGL